MVLETIKKVNASDVFLPLITEGEEDANNYNNGGVKMNKSKRERKFKIGDDVIWTNSNGVNLGKRKIIGYDTRSGETYFEYTYYIDPIDTPWFSIGESELKLCNPLKQEKN
ncbi:hypothetical protein PBN151_1238 [Paenibacillus sp. NAIST15-1]|nr:hypothetical protein PBN151_1238 [Paenibacillus sp. NAIST15-1]